MSMNGPDLSKMPPTIYGAIIIALIAAAAAMEISGSSNTLLVIAALVGVIGLQNVTTSRMVNRVEEQTNGKTTLRFDRIERQLERIEDRLANGDRKFDAQAHEVAEVSHQVSAVKTQIEQLTNCETKPEGER